MPEKRLARTRATLPPGYQFGAHVTPSAAGLTLKFIREYDAARDQWRRPSDNAAERLSERLQYWNTIEDD